jgi:uncharacterized DUF497 family protein
LLGSFNGRQLDRYSAIGFFSGVIELLIIFISAFKDRIIIVSVSIDLWMKIVVL